MSELPSGSAGKTVKITLDRASSRKLLKLQALLAKQVPTPALDEVMELAIHMYVADLETQIKPGSIPREIKRAVYQRDAGRCAVREDDGGRCEKIEGLEFRRIESGSGDLDNLQLLCPDHLPPARILAGFLKRKRGG